jgi:RecA/RadA recombinase
MARKKASAKNVELLEATEVVEEVDGPNEENLEKILSRITKEIEKDLGRGVIVRGTDIIDRPRTLIPVSPAIDPILGGGIPEGSWVVLVGKPKCGKTTLALHFGRTCQQEEWGGRNVYYLNVEGRLKRRDILGIPNMDPNRLIIIESTEDKILTSQEYLTTAQKILYADKGCVLIIDSISALCDEREMVGGIGTQTRGSGAIWVSQFTSQMGNVVPVKKSIVICILHLMSNTSGKGPDWREKGGNAIQYQVDVKLRAEAVVPWTVTEGGEPFGQIVTWKAYSTGIGPPGRKCESYIRYGEGIDEITELCLDAKDVGLITMNGPVWAELSFLENHLEELGLSKWDEKSMKSVGAYLQGQAKLREALLKNPQWLNWLKEDLKAAL